MTNKNAVLTNQVVEEHWLLKQSEYLDIRSAAHMPLWLLCTCSAVIKMKPITLNYSNWSASYKIHHNPVITCLNITRIPIKHGQGHRSKTNLPNANKHIITQPCHKKVLDMAPENS